MSKVRITQDQGSQVRIKPIGGLQVSANGSSQEVKLSVGRGEIGPIGPSGPFGNSVFITQNTSGASLTTNGINFVNTSSITVSVANSPNGYANIAFTAVGDGAYNQANVARNTANAAYAQANIAYGSANTVTVSQNGGSTLSNKQLNFVNTASILAFVSDSGNGNANVSFITNFASPSDAYNQANAAYAQANTARSDANTTFATINTSLATINTNYQAAYAAANAAYAAANADYQPAVTILNVTNNGTSAYRFDQYGATVDAPTLYIRAGETIAFNLNNAGHPFAIRVSNGGANYDTGLTHVATNGTVSTGSSAQGKTSGILYWKVPSTLIGNTYVYQCTVHSGMVGNIVIEPGSTVVYAQANAAYNQANSAYNTANLKLNIAGGTITGSLNVNTDLYVKGDISLDGNLIIGNVNTDTVSVIADFTSNLTPDVNNTFSLGTTEKQWKELHVQDVTVSNNLDVGGTLTTHDIIPDANITYDIGTPTDRFKDIYLANSSIYLGDAKISSNGEALVVTSPGGAIEINAASQTVNTSYLSANVVISGPTETTYNVFTTNADTPIVIDSFPSPKFTTVKYIIQSKSVDGYHATELFCMQDGIEAYLTEYATLINSHTLGSYSLTISGGVCNLYFSPNNPSHNIITVKLVRTALTS